jgi:hypothetical protein
MIVAEPVAEDDERCLLKSNELSPLVFLSLSGELEVWRAPPTGGWTYEALESAEAAVASSPETSGYDAYLGSCWIGSSEC